MILTTKVVARQSWFAARTIRDLSLQRARAGEFGRTLPTIARSTTSVRMPWLPFALIDELALRTGARTRVFEYGGGGSTLWFADRGTRVITVEHDPRWAKVLSEMLSDFRDVAILERARGNDYIEAIQPYEDDSFDVVLVDGRDRVECFIEAIPKVRRGGLLILDDVDRRRYARAFEAIDWPRRKMIGFAPCKPTLAYTAVFERP